MKTSSEVSRWSVFSFVLRFARPTFPTYLPGLILYSAQGFVFPLVTSFFISLVTAALLASDVSGVWRAGGLTLAAMFGVMLMVLVGTYLYVRSLMKSEWELKRRIFRAFLRQSLERRQSSHSGEGVAALNTDADMAGQLYGDVLAGVLSCVIATVFSALTLFWVDWRMGFLSVGIGLLALLAQTKLARPLAVLGKEQLEANAEAVKGISNLLSGGLVLRAFSLQDKALVSFDRDNERQLKISFRGAFVAMWQDMFTTVQGLLTVSGVFAVGAVLVAGGTLTLPALMMIPTLCAALVGGLSAVGGAWANLQARLEAGRRIHTLMGGRAGLSALDTLPDENGGDAWAGGYALSARGLDFQYEGGDAPALTGINLTIRENETVAFVGPSGGGKSTLLRVLVGLYERDRLGLRVGNLAYDRAGLARWRQAFAYVDQ
ncbi:MAG: ABC transporter ATP-binding protein/permease, partial [Oscillospiraceae bacterium]|nr:ABC transporter ATP-binding protein/permease [Oscillospiraceae bacterium]